MGKPMEYYRSRNTFQICDRNYSICILFLVDTNNSFLKSNWYEAQSKPTAFYNKNHNAGLWSYGSNAYICISQGVTQPVCERCTRFYPPTPKCKGELPGRSFSIHLQGCSQRCCGTLDKIKDNVSNLWLQLFFL